ncbi:MAG: methyltransferase domain-containing protein, partial [Chloroflexota bacterium]|nr:methyltransferase domain-containing protein [Chloroflexota bacterium]
VLDVASGDGYLLLPFTERGMSVLGLETDAQVAASARVPTQQGAFSLASAERLAARGWLADLVLVNHALAHVDNVDDFVAGLARILCPGGTIAIEFHHALHVLRGGQFDIVCHAHPNYVTLLALEAAFWRHGLTIVAAYESALHGGSVRAMARRAAERPAVDRSVEAIRKKERAGGLEGLAGYASVGHRAERVKRDLVGFLKSATSAGTLVAGYGAPTRGITLLNYCGVTVESLPFTVDRAPDKQGGFLPGCHIPVRPPEAIAAARPKYVLILPWALSDEIMEQMSVVRTWGGRFVVAVPELRMLN